MTPDLTATPWTDLVPDAGKLYPPMKLARIGFLRDGLAPGRHSVQMIAYDLNSTIKLVEGDFAQMRMSLAAFDVSEQIR